MALDIGPELRIPLAYGDSKILELLCEKLQNYMDQADIQVLLSQLRGELYAEIGEDSARMLHSIVKNCHRCTGVEQPKLPSWNVVDPDVLIVAESPITKGDSVNLLANSLKVAGFSSSRLCLTYLNRCKTKENRKHTTEEISNCLPYLQAEIQILRPKLVLTLGLTATSALLGADIQLSEERGKIHWLGPWPIMPVYTPAYILNGAKHLKETWTGDIKTAYEFVYGRIN